MKTSSRLKWFGWSLLATGLLAAFPTYQWIQRGKKIRECERIAWASVGENEMGISLFFPPMSKEDREAAAINWNAMDQEFLKAFHDRAAHRSFSFETVGLPGDRHSVAICRFIVKFEPKLRDAVHAWLIDRRDDYLRAHATGPVARVAVLGSSGVLPAS